MTAWWACKDINNFGDVLTEYIIEKLTGVKPKHSNADEHVLMCGSVLNQSNENSHILGAGFMSHVDEFAGAKSIELVRGLMSLYKLQQQGYAQKAMVGDPAIVLPYIYKPNVRKRHMIGIVPNYIELDETRARFGNFNVIDLTWPVERVIDWINECHYIMATSLHGLIVAQAYGIPAAWVKLTDNVAGDDFKYRDYITTNAPELPLYPSTFNKPIYSKGDFRNRKQVYNILKTKLNDLFATR